MVSYKSRLTASASISLMLITWLSLFTTLTLASPFRRLRLPTFNKRGVIITNHTTITVEKVTTNTTITNKTSDCPADNIEFPDPSSVILKVPSAYKGDACTAVTDLTTFLKPRVDGGVSTVVIQSSLQDLKLVKVNESQSALPFSNQSTTVHCNVLMEFVIPKSWQMGVVSSDLVYPGTVKLDPGFKFTQSTNYQYYKVNDEDEGPKPGSAELKSECGLSGTANQPGFLCSWAKGDKDPVIWSPCTTAEMPMVILEMETKYSIDEVSARPGAVGMLTMPNQTLPVSLLQMVGLQWRKC